MLKKSKSFICLDFGAGTLKAAEFEPSDAGTLVLKRYGVKALGLPGSLESAREGALKKALQELLTEKQFSSKRVNVCAPGLHVFSKFVKLPAVDTSKVTQIIQYEAQQNVPFPLPEAVWDFQITGTTPTNELEVFLVAIKADLVEGVFRVCDTAGLRLELVDVSPAALCNAFRFNYGDLEGCTMLLDIGAKTSNLLFFEKGKVFSRGINIGANSITQDFAAESKMRFNEAEQVKIAEGFVSLGGAYEEPDNPHQAAISKIARQVMTRLHIQVNQTIQFYRSQQGGTAPQRMFLAGGASIMPYTAQFFAEKLNVEVEYFNPFRSIQIDPEIDLEELSGVAHSYGEVVGLGLRNIAQCPVELNLVPKSIRSRQTFDQKKPYIMAALFALVLVVFAYGWFYHQVAQVKAKALTDIENEVYPLQETEEGLKKHEAQIRASRSQIQTYVGLVEDRFYWPDLLAEIRRLLLETEKKLQRPNMDIGVWVETMGAVGLLNSGTRILGASYGEDYYNPMQTFMPYMMDPRMMERYGFMMDPRLFGGGKPEEEAVEDEEPETLKAEPETPEDKSKQVTSIDITFRAVNLNRDGSNLSGNSDLSYEVESQFQSSPFFEKDGTELSKYDQLRGAESVTFTFSMKLKLKKPLPN